MSTVQKLIILVILLAISDLIWPVFGLIRPTMRDVWIATATFLRETGAATNAGTPHAVSSSSEALSNIYILRNLGLVLAGFFGVTLAGWRAVEYSRETAVKAEGHITDRFIKASEQLGSEHITVRIGAINSLWRIAMDSKRQDDKRAVLDVLCGFVRNSHAKKEEVKGSFVASVETSPDALCQPPK